MSAFAVGDRVRIAAPEHPWNGSRGVISAPFDVPLTDLAWKVRIERDDALDGHEAAAAESDLRHLGTTP